jgi:hypothetical protein
MISVPVIVRVYFPLGALTVFDEEPPPPQPDIAKPTAIKKKTPANMRSLRVRYPNTPANTRPIRVTPARTTFKEECGSFAAEVTPAATIFILPLPPCIAAPLHSAALVMIVIVTGTGPFPGTIALGIKTQAVFVRDVLLVETDHATVPL